MDCRLGCGACCIAPSITSAIPGMPNGKPAGVRCVHLDQRNLCRLFGKPERPDVCSRFQASTDVCGDSRDQALWLLTNLEQQTCS
ncbi:MULTISPECIES: YkgJ family cysteine cluster protein [Shewanella]|uniref:YkgJ family cysteine cluster protein n=1 Tax=Shewanella TaxID=22 RepID=UPI001671F03C|nr:YkgJ family cysteine cluster protein [Shewanella fodinae]MBO1272349.1 YkgJ family cysteine cluster protein [Shewanella sp. 4t3-1-2LB]MCL2908288.1 YkgJ family cysteine cluster protein [Shewanella fodinae]